MTPAEAAADALGVWSPEEALARWAPQLLSRFAGVVREAVARAPQAARQSGLVQVAGGLAG